MIDARDLWRPHRPLYFPKLETRSPRRFTWSLLAKLSCLFFCLFSEENNRPQEKTKCQRSRERRLLKRKVRPNAFVPRCKANGDFKATQCHKRTKYCWCVNRDGKQIPETRVRYGKPNCKTGKLMAFADSPPENMLATEPVVSFMDFSKITNLLLYYKGGGAVSFYGARFPPSPTVLSLHPRSSSLSHMWCGDLW